MQYNDIHELLHQAERAERWVLEKQASETRPTYNSGRRGFSPIDGGFSAKPTPYKSGSIEQSKVAAVPKEVLMFHLVRGHRITVILFGTSVEDVDT